MSPPHTRAPPCLTPVHVVIDTCQASLSKPIGVFDECDSCTSNNFANFVLFGIVATTSDDLLRANGLSLFASYFYMSSSRKSGESTRAADARVSVCDVASCGVRVCAGVYACLSRSGPVDEPAEGGRAQSHGHCAQRQVDGAGAVHGVAFLLPCVCVTSVHCMRVCVCNGARHSCEMAVAPRCSRTSCRKWARSDRRRTAR